MKPIKDNERKTGRPEDWKVGFALRPSNFHHSIIPSFLVLILTLTFFSCNKSAGLGGSATLTVYGAHHANTIINHVGYPDTVFLKYNVDEFPGTKPSDYDSYFIGTPPEEFVKIEGLKKGKYFVYMVGRDTAWGPTGARVTGGVALKIKRSEKSDNITLNIPLSE
jgi:hypothetical protein